MGDTFSPSPGRGKDMNWGGEDGKRVIVLRKCLRESMLVDIKKVRTIKEIVVESGTHLRYEDGLVVTEENGTCSQEDRMRKQEMMART